MNEVRAYELHPGDIFSVDLNIFMSESTLWSRQFQIVRFDKFKRKWWQFWKPKWTNFVQIMFVGKE